MDRAGWPSTAWANSSDLSHKDETWLSNIPVLTFSNPDASKVDESSKTDERRRKLLIAWPPGVICVWKNMSVERFLCLLVIAPNSGFYFPLDGLLMTGLIRMNAERREIKTRCTLQGAAANYTYIRLKWGDGLRFVWIWTNTGLCVPSCLLSVSLPQARCLSVCSWCPSPPSCVLFGW